MKVSESLLLSEQRLLVRPVSFVAWPSEVLSMPYELIEQFLCIVATTTYCSSFAPNSVTGDTWRFRCRCVLVSPIHIVQLRAFKHRGSQKHARHVNIRLHTISQSLVLLCRW